MFAGVGDLSADFVAQVCKYPGRKKP
jgi:hypothetical protein